MVRTLGDVLTQRTANTFVGRAEELAGLLAMLDANDPPVIVLHGIAGKSSLLAPDHLSGAGATAHEDVPDRTTDLDAIVHTGILGTQPCEIARGQSLVNEGLEWSSRGPSHQEIPTAPTRILPGGKGHGQGEAQRG